MKGVFLSSLRDEGDMIFELAGEYGLGIELQGFIEQYRIDDFENKVKLTKDKLAHIKQCALHGPFMDLFPASRDPEILGVVRKRFLKACETARAFNAQHIVFHGAYIPKICFPQDWLIASIEFWRAFMPLIGQDIEIHIENVCEDDYSLIKELIEAVDNPAFSACLDVGHANINSDKTLESWVKGLNNHIRYVHLHNNDGIADKHYGLCNGTINMKEVLELLQIYAPDAIWTLETKLEETMESALWLEKMGYIKRSSE